MIEGIDIFEPRSNGLPDFTKISPAQIFNGSIAASLQSMKDNDPYGLQDKPLGYEGVAEGTDKQTTIDPLTGKRVEVRRAKVVEELLNGGAPAARGHRPASTPRRRSYAAPSDAVEPPLPDEGNILVDPINDGVPPNEGPYSPLLPPPTPEEEKKTALGRLPVMLLDELKNLGYRV